MLYSWNIDLYNKAPDPALVVGNELYVTIVILDGGALSSCHPKIMWHPNELIG